MVVGRCGSGPVIGFLVCLSDVGYGEDGVVKWVTWNKLNLLMFFCAASVRLIVRWEDEHSHALCTSDR
jgi:hypothetical protein